MSVIQQAIVATSGGSAPPSMSLSSFIPNPASEGSPIDVFYNFNNFTGQTVYWTTTYSNATEANFTGSTSGAFSLNGSGTNGVLVIYPKADYYTQGNWLVNVNFGSQPGWNDYFNTGWITVQDTSHTVSCTLNETHGNVDEGQTNTFTFTDTSNQLAGQTLYWHIASTSGGNMSPSRFPGDGKGTFVMNNANPPVGTFDVTVSADHKTSPVQQSYQIAVYGGDPDNGGIQLIVTGAITVNDTSQSVTSFDLVNPPSNVNLLPWVDSASGVSATVVGGWTAPADHGGAVGLLGNGYIEVSYTNTSPTFTLSLAADFESAGSNWNSVFSGGSYYGTDIFAFLPGSNNSVINVGTGTDQGQATIATNGLAWWDFVYDGQSVKVYKNGTNEANITLGTANTGFQNNLWIGQRYGSATDYLTGSIYRIRYTQTALDQTAISTQFASVQSTYGL